MSLQRCVRSRNSSTTSAWDACLTAATWWEGFPVDLQSVGLATPLGRVLPDRPSLERKCPSLPQPILAVSNLPMKLSVGSDPPTGRGPSPEPQPFHFASSRGLHACLVHQKSNSNQRARALAVSCRPGRTEWDALAVSQKNGLSVRLRHSWPQDLAEATDSHLGLRSLIYKIN